MAWRDGTRHQIAPDASAIAWRSMRHPALTASCRPQNFMDNNPRAIEIISQFQQSQAPAGGGVSSSVRPAAAGPGPASYAATTGGPAQQQAPPQNLTPYRKPAQEELELSPVSSKTGKGRSQPGSRAASPQASAPPPLPGALPFAACAVAGATTPCAPPVHASLARRPHRGVVRGAGGWDAGRNERTACRVRLQLPAPSEAGPPTARQQAEATLAMFKTGGRIKRRAATPPNAQQVQPHPGFGVIGLEPAKRSFSIPGP